jgi:sporulation integral membrane protein YtvI
VRVKRWILVLIWIAVFYLSTRFSLSLIGPFMLGLLIAALAEPLIRFMEQNWRWSRTLATFTALTIGIALFGIIILLITIGVYSEVRDLVGDLPRLLERGKEFSLFLNRTFQKWESSLTEEMYRVIVKIIDGSIDALTRFALSTIGIVEKLPHVIGTLIIAGISAFYFARDKEYWIKLISRYIPSSWRSLAQSLSNDLVRTLLGWARLELTMMSWAFLLTGGALTIFGYPSAWFVGLVAGLLEPIPMVGPGALLFPWAGWSIVTGDWRFAAILLLISIVLLITREWAEIKILGRDLGVHPLLSLAVIYIGVNLLGLTGILIGPLAIITLRTIIRSLRDGSLDSPSI